MDAKYLAEIKAREQAATPGPWWNDDETVWGGATGGNGATGKTIVHDDDMNFTLAPENVSFISHSRTDIPALLAEVERLNAYESIDLLPEQIEAMQGHNIALIEENAAKDQQIATLKKALEIASMEVNVAFETLESHHVITMERKASGTQENIDAWIQKAKQAQEQEEKK